MQIISRLLAGALVIALVLVSGCTDRGHNPEPEIFGDSGVLTQPTGHVFFGEFLTQIRNKERLGFWTAYAPYVQQWGPPPVYNPPQKLPLLVLLPPHGGDQHYYFNHGLAQIANELLQEGLIEPMIIFSLGNDQVFGGYWWGGDNGGSGNYDTLIGGTMIDFIYTITGQDVFDSTRGMTAIGGIGTGAYGAIRAAIMHQDRFGSVSALDGPLDFDGADGSSGIIDLFDDVLNEQGTFGQSFYTDSLDTAGSNHLTRFIIGGSLAFSPHDTLVFPVVDSFSTGVTVTVPDSVRYKIQGTQTLVSSIVNQGDVTYDYDFHLPFDENGQPFSAADEPIWDLWLRNNLEQLWADSSAGTGLAETDFWLGWSRDFDPRGFNTMTQSFESFLRAQGFDPDTLSYEGYEGNPAVGDEYLSWVLREILIFHSNKFKEAREQAR